MNINEMLKRLKIIPVVKINRPEDAVPLARALINGGLPVAEITFRTAAAEESIRLIKAAEPEMLILAGTVLDVATAVRAVNAGARGIVSPGTNTEVVFWCKENKISVFPGCATPTEIENCMRLGLDTVKLFPAETVGGVSALKAFAGPYGNMRFMPTGGISKENVREYLNLSNVICCGGSWLTPNELISGGQFDKIADIVRDTVAML